MKLLLQVGDHRRVWDAIEDLHDFLKIILPYSLVVAEQTYFDSLNEADNYGFRI